MQCCQCNGPEPGMYYIANSQLSPFGNAVTVTDAGCNHPVIVSSKATEPGSQKWMVSGNPGLPQTIAPVSQSGLETGPMGNYVEVLPPNGYTWCITSRTGQPGYIIMEPQTKRIWGIDKAVEGQPIMLEMDNGSSLQLWEFMLA